MDTSCFTNDSLIVFEQCTISGVENHVIQGDIVRVLKGSSHANFTNGRDIILVRVTKVALETPSVVVCPSHIDSLDGGEGQRRLSRSEGKGDAEDKQRKSATHDFSRRKLVCWNSAWWSALTESEYRQLSIDLDTYWRHVQLSVSTESQYNKELGNQMHKWCKALFSSVFAQFILLV